MTDLVREPTMVQPLAEVSTEIPLYVELCGVPGVGKTTLARLAGERLRELGYTVCLPRASYTPRLRRFARARRLVDALCHAAGRPGDASLGLRLARLFPQPGYLTALRLHYAVASTHAMLAYHAARTALNIIDQGYYQLLYSYASRSERWDRLRLQEAAELLPQPDVVIFVTASVANVTARLAQRGIPLPRAGRKADNLAFVRKSVAVIEALSQLSGSTPARFIHHDTTDQSAETASHALAEAIDRCVGGGIGVARRFGATADHASALAARAPLATGLGDPPTTPGGHCGRQALRELRDGRIEH